MEYNHTQYGYLHWLLLLPAAAMLIAATRLARVEPPIAVVLTVAGAVLVLTAQMFGRLTVRDEGQWLAVRYGPLPVLRKRIRYAEITAVEPGRSSILDGWGIHWCPGRGWTYNLWGFDCVRLTLGRRTLRVGTDDPQGLAAFLRQRMAAPRG
jgi:hypothetical protein